MTERIKDLEDKIKHQKRQLAQLNVSQREKNLALDAMHYVWCTGACEGGIHRWCKPELTREMVNEAVATVNRLTRRFSNTNLLFEKDKRDLFLRLLWSKEWHCRLFRWIMIKI